MSQATFGPFQLDLARGTLLHAGVQIELGSRSLEILRVLAQAEGALVTKDELLTKVWQGVVVEENTLQVHVSALRKHLARLDDSVAWVVTVPGRGYRLAQAHLVAASESPLDFLDKTSIAVLPFVNRSGDAEQEYFADGISEDILTALSRFRWFLVIARNSSFAYKGRNVGTQQIGRELGVRYVLEGSVRRAGDRIRISAHLVDTIAGVDMWSEQFDRELSDIFAVQDEITNSVCGAIEPELLSAEGARAARRHAPSLGQWDLIRQGIWNFHKLTEGTHRRVLELFREAARMEAGTPEAQMWVSRAATGVVAYGWGSDAESLMRESRQAAESAVRGAPRDPYAYFALAMAQIFSERPLDAVRSAQRSIELSPSFALGHLGLGMAWLYGGNALEAIPPLRHGLRLNPADPQNTHWFRILALAYLFAGDKMQALSFAERALACRPGWPLTLETLAACHAALGQYGQARALLAEMRSLPALPGAPTDIMFRMQPQWAAEIAGHLSQAQSGASSYVTSSPSSTPRG